MTTSTIILAGRTFDDSYDADGIKWSWTDLQGWDGVPVRQAVLERNGVDGAAVSSSRYGPRGLVLAGVASWEGPYPNEDLYWLAREKILDTTDTLDDLQTIVVNEPTPKQASVRRSSQQPRMRTLGRMVAVEFQLPLIARDPRKYGTTPVTESISGSNTNAGRYRTPPSILVDNPDGGGVVRVTSVTDAGKYVELATTGYAGTDIVIDVASRSVTVGGTPADELVAAGTRWWELLPGPNDITLIGAADAILTWRPAWI